MEEDTIKKGDTVSFKGISGIYFCEPRFGVVAMRPIPAVSMTTNKAADLGGRGLMLYINGSTSFFNIEQYDKQELIPCSRVVLFEKCTVHLVHTENKSRRLIDNRRNS